MRSRHTIKITEETTTTVIRMSHLGICLCPVCVLHRNAPTGPSSVETALAVTNQIDGAVIEKHTELDRQLDTNLRRQSK